MNVTQAIAKSKTYTIDSMAFSDDKLLWDEGKVGIDEEWEWDEENVGTKGRLE